MSEDPGSTLRIYVEARTAHLERARADGATVAYFRTSYDFDEALASEVGAQRIDKLGAFRLVRSGRYGVVEVNEPLMLSAWSALLPIAAANVLSGRHSRSQLVSYAIENGDVATWLSSKARLPLWVAKPVTRLIGRFLTSRLTKLAFGTEAARARYQATLGGIPVQAQLFTALEPACACLSQGGDSTAQRSGVVFVGSFERRKGIPELMAAWDSIDDTGLSLTILGKGPLEEELRTWRHPDVRMIVDPDRRAIHEALRNAATLVLLSQPAARWREQIGLPLLEGLSHGCEIVTTTETGLAPWLISNGHHVVDPSASPVSVASAIRTSARNPRGPANVTSALPRESGRRQAAEWLAS